jgi:glycosyltransferase involved in cell wall biosynthesis
MQQVLLISCLLLFICYAILILYYAVSWINIPIVTPSTLNHQPFTKLSIIIPARNEEKNIHACLASVINQSYPKELYEIIVVDDHSTDSTVQIVQSFKAPNIKLLPLKDFIGKETNAYKKKGIEVAISQANGTLIITTDADCTAPENWLQTIAHFAGCHKLEQKFFRALSVTRFYDAAGYYRFGGI